MCRLYAFSKENQISVKDFDDNWSDAITSEQFNKLWLMHYISLKDQVYIWHNDQFGQVEPLEI